MIIHDKKCLNFNDDDKNLEKGIWILDHWLICGFDLTHTRSIFIFWSTLGLGILNCLMSLSCISLSSHIAAFCGVIKVNTSVNLLLYLLN